jgi:hypothetical protein
MLSLTIVDFYLCDEAIEDSDILNNEWFVVVKKDDFYFKCIERLSNHPKFIESYSIGKAKDNLVVIRLKGLHKDILEAFL